jgi:DNA-binding response OmpR family regulator
MKNEKWHILVVDDEPRVLRFIEISLKREGFEVSTTTSGKTAIDIVKTKKPHVMVLDILMPDMNGFEVLKQLREFSTIPVIAISASLAVQNDIIRRGADYFIVKPFDPNDLAIMISRLLDR